MYWLLGFLIGIMLLNFVIWLWNYHIYPYFLTRDMQETEKEVFLLDYYDSLPESDE